MARGKDHPLPAHLRPLRAATGEHGALPATAEGLSTHTARGERKFADQSHIEVVLLGAESEDAIRVTHPIYFETDFLAREIRRPALARRGARRRP